MRVADPGVREGLQALQTAVQDGAQVVRRLQDFARQRAAGQLVPLDLGALVREVLDITRPRWRDEPQQRGLSVRAELNLEGLPPILGQAGEVRDALINVIFNALDAMPAGGTLRFAGRVVPAGSGAPAGEDPGGAQGAAPWVELDVTDSGVGMSEEVRRRMFDPFFTTKGLRGSGLGLSLVYGIMERHGGKVTAVSRPGQGTTLTLRFRSAPGAVLPQPGPAPPAPAPRRILLVDDEPGVRETVRALLEAVGHVVHEAPGGRQALALLEGAGAEFDLVLTDLGMPGVTGWDVARAAKRAAPARPVVLMTGWGEQVEASETERALVDLILAKPCPLETLQAAIAGLEGNT